MLKRNWLNYYRLVILSWLIAFQLRLLGLSKGIWLDEYASIHDAQSFASPQIIERIQTSFAHPPLYFFLLRGWMVLGQQEEFLRYFSVILAMVMMALTMRWLRLYNRPASLLGGILVMTWPILLRYSMEIRHYTLWVLAVVAAFYFATLLAAHPDKKRYYVALALSLGTVVSVQLVGILVCLPIGVFILLQQPRVWLRKERLMGLAIIMICPFSLELLYLWALPMARGSLTFWIRPVTPDYLAGFSWQLFGLNDFRSSLQSLFAWAHLDGWLSNQPVLGWFIGGILVISMVGGGIKNYALLIAAGLFWLEMIIYSWVKQPILLDRTAIPGLIPLIGYIAVQISGARSAALRLGLSLVISLTALAYAFNWTTQAAWKPFENWRSAAQTISDNWQPASLVIFYPHFIRGVAQYYLGPLPNEGIILVNPRTQINSDYFKKVNSTCQTATQAIPIFLFIRPDATVQQNKNIFEQLVNSLAFSLPAPCQLEVILLAGEIQPGDKQRPQRINWVLSGLQTHFGPPEVIPGRGFVWLRYQ